MNEQCGSPWDSWVSDKTVKVGVGWETRKQDQKGRSKGVYTEMEKRGLQTNACSEQTEE